MICTQVTVMDNLLTGRILYWGPTYGFLFSASWGSLLLRARYSPSRERD